MPRPIEKTLRKELRDSNFNFIPNGVYSQKELYERVEQQFPTLCDNHYLCIENCNSGTNSPEWQHAVRSVMQQFKTQGRLVNQSRGYWNLV
jgi:hypothetical protein